MATVRPDLMKDWDWESNKEIDPSNLLPGSNQKVAWKCHVCGHSWTTILNKRDCGNTGCKACAMKALHEKRKKNNKKPSDFDKWLD